MSMWVRPDTRAGSCKKRFEVVEADELHVEDTPAGQAGVERRDAEETRNRTL